MPTPSALREGLDDLSTLAAADLRKLWRQVNDAVQAREALADVLPALIRTYGLAAGALAADWYDEVRDELNVAGRFFAIPVEPKIGGSEVLARFGVGPLFKTEPDWMAARTLVEGALQYRVAQVARKTVAGSSVADPKARGWQRSASGGCVFCQMLASRGSVYSQATAGFAAHSHCRCIAVPAFDGHPSPVKPYTPSLRNSTDADRARVRAYLAEHHAG